MRHPPRKAVECERCGPFQILCPFTVSLQHFYDFSSALCHPKRVPLNVSDFVAHQI